MTTIKPSIVSCGMTLWAVFGLVSSSALKIRRGKGPPRAELPGHKRPFGCVDDLLVQGQPSPERKLKWHYECKFVCTVADGTEAVKKIFLGIFLVLCRNFGAAWMQGIKSTAPGLWVIVISDYRLFLYLIRLELASQVIITTVPIICYSTGILLI